MRTKASDRSIALPESRPWENLQGESDYAYGAFCQYLDLPKRGDPERTKDGARRFYEDLAKQRNVPISSICSMARKWCWIDRAIAYDQFLAFNPAKIAELEARRQFTAELREAAIDIRQKALAAIQEMGFRDMSEAVKLYQLGVQLEEKAQKFEDPDVESKRKNLVSDIRGLVESITAGLGRVASGGTGGTLPATERTISLDLPGPGDGGMRALPEEATSVREGSSGTQLVASGDPVGRDGGD